MSFLNNIIIHGGLEVIVLSKSKYFESNPLRKQGNKAEENMQYLLKRYFRKDKKLFVFNDLLLEDDGIFAQIDHLILTTYGFVLIESKSCLGEIAYNDKDEWSRRTGTYMQGFKSPVQQVKMQRDLLKSILSANLEILLGKLLGIQQTINHRVYECYIAVDESAIIKRGTNKFDKIVLKADKVPDQILKDLKKRNNFLKLDGSPRFSEKEVKNLINFIIKEDERARSLKSKEKTKEFKGDSCGKCYSYEHLEIVYGKYGYYFKCSHCLENNPIKESCKSCSSKMKVSKNKDIYYIVCSRCNASEVFQKTKV